MTNKLFIRLLGRFTSNYRLIESTKISPCGTPLFQVVAAKTFTLANGVTIDEGTVGGWIEKASNLSGNAWVADNAMVLGDAKVFGGALISDNAVVRDNAKVSGNVHIFADAVVCENTMIGDKAMASKPKFRPNWVNIFKCYALVHIIFALATYNLITGVFSLVVIVVSVFFVLPASWFICDMVKLFGN